MKYKNAIISALGSWGNSYSKNETFDVKIKPKKTVWVTFVSAVIRTRETRIL